MLPPQFILHEEKKVLTFPTFFLVSSQSGGNVPEIRGCSFVSCGVPARLPGPDTEEFGEWKEVTILFGLSPPS